MSSVFTISIASSEFRPVAELGISVATRTLRNMGADIVSLDVVPGAFTDDPIINYGDLVKIQKDGSPWFQGFGMDAAISGDPAAHGHNFAVMGPWYSIDKVIYMQKFPYVAGTGDIYSSRVLLGATEDNSGVVQYANSSAIKTSVAIQKALIYARDIIGTASANAFTLGFSAGSGVEMFAEEYRDTTCAQAVQAIMRYHPTAVLWFDYTTSPPTLQIAARGVSRIGDRLQDVYLPAQDTGVASLKIRARNDLVIPGVIIKYEQISDTDNTASIYQIDRYPGISFTQPPVGALMTTVTVDNQTAWALPSASGFYIGIPNGLAQFIYEEYQDLHYDGAITLIDDNPGARQLMGCALSLTGGRTEWASMRAMIQGVSENIKTGVCTVSFAPAPMAGIDTWKRLMQLHGARGIAGRPKSQGARDIPTSVHNTARNVATTVFDGQDGLVSSTIANIQGLISGGGSQTDINNQLVYLGQTIQGYFNQVRTNFNRP